MVARIVNVTHSRAMRILVRRTLYQLFLTAGTATNGGIHQDLRLTTRVSRTLHRTCVLLGHAVTLEVDSGRLMAATLRVMGHILMLSGHVHVNVHQGLRRGLINPVRVRILHDVSAGLGRLSVISLRTRLRQGTIDIVARRLGNVPRLIMVGVKVATIEDTGSSNCANPLNDLRRHRTLVRVNNTIVCAQRSVTVGIARESTLVGWAFTQLIGVPFLRTP